MRRIHLASTAVAAVLVASCGGSGSQASNLPPGFYIVISGLAFSPLDLHVPPGASVTVLNNDGMAHSVTSEATPNAFTFATVKDVSFDTHEFMSGVQTFTIPAAAEDGTVISYYCSTHMDQMATPNGTITVDVNAQPQPAPAMSSDMSGGMMGSMSGGLSRSRSSGM